MEVGSDGLPGIRTFVATPLVIIRNAGVADRLAGMGKSGTEQNQASTRFNIAISIAGLIPSF